MSEENLFRLKPETIADYLRELSAIMDTLEAKLYVVYGKKSDIEKEILGTRPFPEAYKYFFAMDIDELATVVSSIRIDPNQIESFTALYHALNDRYKNTEKGF